MNIKTIFLIIFQIAMISAYMPNHQYNMLEKRKSLKTHLHRLLILSGVFKSALTQHRGPCNLRVK